MKIMCHMTSIFISFSLLLQLLLLLLPSVTNGQPQGSSVAQCSYNGYLNASGVCQCRLAWKGADCGVLNLLPTKPDAGLRLNGKDGFVNTWGGSPVKVKTANGTKYALFAATFVNECPVDTWTTNSVIIRTLADHPLGPFDNENFVTLFDTFAHNPEILPLLSPDGEGEPGSGGYALFFIGKRSTKDVQNCSNKTAWKTADVKGPQVPTQRSVDLQGLPWACWVVPEKYFGPSLCVRRAYSSDLLATSWKEEPGVALTGNFLKWDPDVTNPAPAQARRRSASSTPAPIYMAYRAFELRLDTPAPPEQIGMAFAETWNQTQFHRLSSEESIMPGIYGEDPVIWQDEDYNWHMLIHWFRTLENGTTPKERGTSDEQQQWYPNNTNVCEPYGALSPYGLHAFSPDGISWSPSATFAYDCHYEELTAGDTANTSRSTKVVNLRRRERPKVLLSQGHFGDPIVLYNAAQREDRSSYVLAQPVMGSGL